MSNCEALHSEALQALVRHWNHLWVRHGPPKAHGGPSARKQRQKKVPACLAASVRRSRFLNALFAHVPSCGLLKPEHGTLAMPGTICCPYLQELPASLETLDVTKDCSELNVSFGSSARHAGKASEARRLWGALQDLVLALWSIAV